jgi:hypothetical protein
LAFLVASLTAVSTFLDAQKRSEIHRNMGNQYLSLRNKARLFWRIEIDSFSSEKEVVGRLEELNRIRDELNATAPQIPRGAYNRALKGIESGESDYEVDNQDTANGIE